MWKLRNVPMWLALGLLVTLSSRVAAQTPVTDDSLVIASEVRAFLRDRAAGNVPALVDHIWPAKIKPSGREERTATLTALGRTVNERVDRRTPPTGCAIDAEKEIDVAFGTEWAVAAVITWRHGYAAAGEVCLSAVDLLPLQRVAGRWKVSGSMPESGER